MMRAFLSKIVFRWIECERTMALLSRAMDERIGLLYRLAIRMHTFCCPGCSNYRVQLPFLRSALRQARERVDLDRIATFSKEEKERLIRLLTAIDGD